jgi:hypothetical protein
MARLGRRARHSRRAAVADDDAHQLGARADRELAVDVAQVELDRLWAQEERGGGLAVGRSARHLERDLQLLVGSGARSRPGLRGARVRRSRGALRARARPTVVRRAGRGCDRRAQVGGDWTRRPARRRRSPRHSSVRASSNGVSWPARASSNGAWKPSSPASSPRQRAAAARAQRLSDAADVCAQDLVAEPVGHLERAVRCARQGRSCPSAASTRATIASAYAEVAHLPGLLADRTAFAPKASADAQ